MNEPAAAAQRCRPDAEPGGVWSRPGAGVFWAGVWLVYLIPAVAEALDDRHAPLRRIVGVSLVVGFAALYLWWMRQAWGQRADARPLAPWPAPMTPSRWRMTAVLVLLAALSTAIVGEPAAGTFVFLAPVAASALPIDRALLGIALAAGSAIAAEAFAARPPGDVVTTDSIASVGFGAVMAGVITLGVRRMRSMLREVQIARAREQELAGVQERVRIARDLHDVLGHSLTVISVRSQLAQRLSDRGETERAATEIGAVGALARDAMAEVRAAVAGYRVRSLAAELAAAEVALEGAGVGVRVERSADAVPADGEDALAFVIREGVTNVLRHSAARQCWIRATLDGERFVVEVADDGSGVGRPLQPVDPEVGVGASSGLRGLAERMAFVGGRISAGDDNGRFVLRAEVAA